MLEFQDIFKIQKCLDYLKIYFPVKFWSSK